MGASAALDESVGTVVALAFAASAASAASAAASLGPSLALASTISIGMGVGTAPYAAPEPAFAITPDIASERSSVGPSLAFASSNGVTAAPYGGVTVTPAGLLQSVAATAEPTAPAAKIAARDSRPASVRVGPISTLALAPQNGQIGSPLLT
jgi:hypothetical protein